MYNDFQSRTMLLLGAGFLMIGTTLIVTGAIVAAEGWMAIGAFLTSIAIFTRLNTPS